MINRDDLLKQESMYLYGGKVWKIVSYCPGPSVEMQCITSGEQMSFGLGGLIDKAFKEIKEAKDGRSR